jgi:hypothetical protein
MPYLKKAVIMPIAGHDYSKPSPFILAEAGFPVNMRAYKGEMKKSPGKVKHGSTAIAGGQVMGLGVLELATVAKYLVRASKTKIQGYNAVSGEWASIGTDFSGGDDDFVSFANDSSNGLLIITNYVNLIRKWTGAGNTEVLAGDPPRARLVEYLAPYVVLGYVDDGIAANPWKIQWGDTDDPETWTGGNTGALLLASDPSVLKRLKLLGNGIAAYKENALAMIRKVGTSDIFDLETVCVGVGLAAQRAVVSDESGFHYFMGSNNFYRWAGGIPDPIGTSISEEIFNRLDRGKIGRSFAIHVKQYSEIWFFVIISGNEWPTEVWKYNYKTGFWYMDQCNLLTDAIAWQRTVAQTWNEDTGSGSDDGTWDQALDTWDAGNVTDSGSEIILGRSDGYTLKLDDAISEDDGSAIEARFDTKDYIGGEIDVKVRFLELDITAKGPGSMSVAYSIDFGDTWVTIPYSSTQVYYDLTDLYQTFKTYLDVVAEHIRFRIQERTLGKTIYLRSFQPYFLPRERSR